MSGKSKCKILKQIRQEIARRNDIEYVVSECRYQGECKGTCPKCEQEVRYLEKELEKRRAAGKNVLVAGLAASLMVTATGCSAITDRIFGDPVVLQGDVPYCEEDVIGEVPDSYIEEGTSPDESGEEEYELEGYASYYEVEVDEETPDSDISPDESGEDTP